jgi:uncharacterized membrane protein YqjE
MGTDLDNLPVLLGRLGDNVMQLVETKLNLLKVEVKEDVEAYAHSGAVMGAGAAICAIGFLLLNVAVAIFVSLAFSFSPPVNYALGFVITGAVYTIGGYIALTAAKKRMAQTDLVPRRSVAELRKDEQWVKHEL